jgi:hypothetical protein
MPSGGTVTLTNGATEIVVPQNTAIDPTSGAITVSEGGTITLPGGSDAGVDFIVPAGTTIDPATGVVSVAADAGVLTLPGGDGVTGTDQDIQIVVPEGTTINPGTGLVTLVNGGWTVLPGPNGVIDSLLRRGRNAALGDSEIDVRGDDLAFYLSAGTTTDPYTGVVKITKSGEITLPDGSTAAVASGSTIDPFTGEVTQPRVGANDDADKTSGSGCDSTGMGVIGLWMIAALASSRLYSKPGRAAKRA